MINRSSVTLKTRHKEEDGKKERETRNEANQANRRKRNVSREKEM
jgi:hypothetical protein